MTSSCIRALKLFLLGGRHDYKPVSDNEIELVEHKIITKTMYYFNGEDYLRLSNVISFHKNGIGIGGDTFIRYEYIPIFKSGSVENSVLLITFTNLIHGKIVLHDHLSQVLIRFETRREVETFKRTLYDKMLYVKNHDTYDNRINRFRTFGLLYKDRAKNLILKQKNERNINLRRGDSSRTDYRIFKNNECFQLPESTDTCRG